MLRWLRNLFGIKMAAPFDAAAALASWFANASASGTPRGLKWVGYESTAEAVFVRDGPRRLALVPVRVQFEPLPDGGFEDVPQASEPREVVVMFAEIRGGWDTGRALFNVAVESLLERNAKRWTLSQHPK